MHIIKIHPSRHKLNYYLYEAILGVRFDRRNFAAKMLKLGLLKPMGSRPANAARRIPQTYCFKEDKYNELKQSGFRLEF